MTDKAEFFVVPRELDQWMRTQIHEGMETGTAEDVWRRALAAAPKYEAGDAVEAAYQAWDHCTSSSKLVAMRAALQAAFPALVARVGELEAAIIVAQNATNLAQGRAELAEAEVERLKGAK